MKIKQYIKNPIRTVLLTVNCLLLTVMSSCTLVDLEEPLKGNITLTTDWSKRTAGVEQPASYIVAINNQTLTFSNISNRLPEFVAGTYPIYVYNTPDKITINGTTATVATNNGQIEPQPDYLFTATTQAVYADFKEETITAAMQQQVRQLNITLKPQGSTADKITNITASLSGVAGAWNFKTNQATGNAMNVPLSFVKQADGTWQATVRLLGITGNVQKLTGVIAFEDNSPADINLESELSSDLSAFNTDKINPLSLRGNIEIPSQAGFTVTISQWQQGNGGSGIAN